MLPGSMQRPKNGPNLVNGIKGDAIPQVFGPTGQSPAGNFLPGQFPAIAVTPQAPPPTRKLGTVHRVRLGGNIGEVVVQSDRPGGQCLLDCPVTILHTSRLSHVLMMTTCMR